MLHSSLRSQRGRNELQFFLRWLRRPGRIGAVVPSGEALATALAEKVDLGTAGIVVELGPGTGSVTEAILKAGVPPENLVLVEREAPFCAVLAERFPDVRVLKGNARNLQALLAKAGAGPVRTVVSSLPLVSIAREDQRKILSEVAALIGRDGVFLQYTYGLWPPVPASLSEELGLTGERTDWIFANLPPATVWRYRRTQAVADLQRAA